MSANEIDFDFAFKRQASSLQLGPERWRLTSEKDELAGGMAIRRRCGFTTRGKGEVDAGGEIGKEV